MRDIVIALDLEMNKPSNKIFEIGVAVGRVGGGLVISKDFSVDIEEPFDPFIINLCHIHLPKYDFCKQPLGDAWRGVRDFLESCKDEPSLGLDCWNPKNRFPNFLVWGTGDVPLLKRQLEPILGPQNMYGHAKKDFDPQWTFGRRWLDVKSVYQTYALANLLGAVAGLGTALKRMDMEFEGVAHTAGADAMNTIRIFQELVKANKN